MSDLLENLLKSRMIFLSSLSQLLPQNTATNALQSQYLTKCRGLTLMLPQKMIKESCPRCCVLYKNAPVVHRIEAAKRRNRFQRRLLQNAESVNTKFKKDYLNSLKSKNATLNDNFLVRICGVCKHKTKKVLQKPDVEDSFEIRTVPNKPKKKKKKDRFSGLNMDAVLSATPQLKAPQKMIHEAPTQSTPKTVLNKFQVKRKNKIENKKKLKGLKNIFTESSKSSPGNSLKNFLNSL